MITPLENFTATANVMGAEVDLAWILPDTLPVNYKVYIFQRFKQDVDQVNDIDRYFENMGDLSGYDYKKLFVLDNISNYDLEAQVISVINGFKYYYKAVIRDEDTGEYSAAVSANVTPDCTLVIETKDGKEMVKQALESMLDSLKDSAGKKVTLHKDIEVVKSFQIGQISGDQIMIERVNGNTQYQYAGSVYATYQHQLMLGELDVDVIRATYLTGAGNDRRDLLSNIFRGRKIWLKKRLKQSGAKEATVTIEGDYYNPQIHGENALGVTLIFTLLLQNLTKENLPVYTEQITDMKVT